jgi:hypothetical protein
VNIKVEPGGALKFIRRKQSASFGDFIRCRFDADVPDIDYAWRK